MASFQALHVYSNLFEKYPPELKFVLFSDDVGGIRDANGQVTHRYQNFPAWAITFHKIPEADFPSFGGGGGVTSASSAPQTARSPLLSDVVAIVDARTGKPILAFSEGAGDF